MYDKNICTGYLKSDLKQLYEWTNEWMMIFNPDPTKPAEKVIFTNKASTSYDTISYS